MEQTPDGQAAHRTTLLARLATADRMMTAVSPSGLFLGGDGMSGCGAGSLVATHSHRYVPHPPCAVHAPSVQLRCAPCVLLGCTASARIAAPSLVSSGDRFSCTSALPRCPPAWAERVERVRCSAGSVQRCAGATVRGVCATARLVEHCEHSRRVCGDAGGRSAAGGQLQWIIQRQCHQ